MTLIHFFVFVLGLTGFIALALAMPKHSQHVLRLTLSDSSRRLLRIFGWVLLAFALGLGIAQWHFDVGTVTWLGWLSIAGIALVFYLPNWPWQPEAKPAKSRREKCSDGEAASAAPITTSHRLPMVRTGLAATALFIPLAAFAWQLLATPDKPLLREDAVHGQIGPWSFTLAEGDQKPPEIVAMDMPLKQFVIRFCDGCDRDIRMAYLKVREPRLLLGAEGSLRAAGNAFEGRGREKAAVIPLPPAATLEDGLWLTVEANNGDEYHQQFAIQRLSPALARFIQEDK